jgi:hypothetical protein
MQMTSLQNDLVETWQNGWYAGKAHGFQQGLKAGKLLVLHNVLNQSFEGDLPAELLDKLYRQSHAEIDRLILELPAITSKKDLQDWLNNTAPKSVFEE